MATVLRLKETHRSGPAPDISEHTYGRRAAIRKWFHNLYREKPDEQFNGDECISLEEAESLVMVPSFNLTSGPSTTESSRSASPEKKQTRTHRNKIKELKVHLKIKLSHFKHRHARGLTEKDGSEKDAKNDADKAEIEDLCVQDLFAEQDKNDLMDGKTKSSAEDGTDVLAEISTSKACEEHEDERAKGTAEQQLPEAATGISLTSEGICGTKRLSNDDRNNASVKRPCSSKAVGSSSSNETSEDTSDANQFEQSSVEKTPSAYLTKSPTGPEPDSAQHLQAAEDSQPVFDSSSEAYETTSDSMEDSDDFSSSEDMSFSDESSATGGDTAQQSEACTSPIASEACTSPIESEKVYTIPTFRKKVGTLNVSNIVKSFREGTLSQDQLIEIANKGVDGHGDLTFRNKEFYDDISPARSSIKANEKMDEKKPSKEQSSNVEKNSKPIKTQKSGSVKFDRFSCLIVYERPVNASQSRIKEPASSNAYEGTVRLNKKPHSPAQGQKCSGTKSILKVKSNLRAKEENKRADACDRVGVDSFMDLFEHFEHKKQMEECMLPGVREGQLNNYFSENFFPEILEDITITTSANSEFSRSRKATESNIGRKLGAVNCRMVHYSCNHCDSPVARHSTKSKA